MVFFASLMIQMILQNIKSPANQQQLFSGTIQEQGKTN